MLKVMDLLKMPSLVQGYVAAGHGGIFHVVKKLEVMEEPYPAVLEFLVPSEFMLTNFWSMKDNKEGRLELVRSMIEKKCSGLGIMPGPHLGDQIDPEIIELANEHQFPVLYISSSVRWGNVISEYGVLSYSQMAPSYETSLEEVLQIFSDFHADSNVGRFCREIERTLQLPVIMSTDTVYSGERQPVSVALVIARIQTICQDGRNTLVSPISLRLNDDYLAIAYFGKNSLVVTYVPNNELNQPSLQVFHKIAPVIAKELDRLCPSSYHRKSSQIIASLGESEMYLALVKRDHVREIAKELDYRYLVYEQNTYFHYCILLIPRELGENGQIYLEYQKLCEKLNPDLFLFSSVPLDKKGLQRELEPLKYMVNALSYLDGFYSLDELPLLYILAYAPFEYKNRLFSQTEQMAGREDKNFLDTLRLYTVLRNMGHVANLLGIHTNSVKYRLSKALAQLGYEEDSLRGDVYRIQLLLQLELIALES